MFTQTDYDKLQQIMAESPEKKELLTRLLSHHRMEISTISHEIRNPLTLVYSNLQFLENEFPELLPSKHWKNMHQDVEYMKQLLEELSDFNNGDRLSLQSLDTNTFLRNVALSFATSILDTDIQMTSKIPPALPVIQADPVKLRQLLLNLLTNAKAAVLSPALKNPEQLPSIFLEARLAKQSLVIEIRDNGCGITSEQRDKIFEPFVTYKKDGTGLGLALARRIATSHGGTLTVSQSQALSRYLRFLFQYNNTARTRPDTKPPMCAKLSTPPLVNP